MNKKKIEPVKEGKFKKGGQNSAPIPYEKPKVIISGQGCPGRCKNGVR